MTTGKAGGSSSAIPPPTSYHTNRTSEKPLVIDLNMGKVYDYKTDDLADIDE